MIPWITVSGSAPTRRPITGRPAAMASSAARQDSSEPAPINAKASSAWSTPRQVDVAIAGEQHLARETELGDERLETPPPFALADEQESRPRVLREHQAEAADQQLVAAARREAGHAAHHRSSPEVELLADGGAAIAGLEAADVHHPVDTRQTLGGHAGVPGALLDLAADRDQRVGAPVE